VGEVWANGQESSHDFHQAFKAAIQTKGIFTDVVTRGKKLFLGDETTIALLNPPEVLLTDAYPSRGRVFNDRSVVVRIQNGRHSFLFTGDIERRGEQGIVASGAPLESTVLKVPHHGSKGSLDPEFLARVCPQIGVISVGARNPYGHPTPEALSAYESLSTRLYRTDRDGAVMVRSDGDHLRITRAVDLQWQRIALGKGMLGDELENWKRVFSKPF
jgi:competence protein ComEC